ncbi:ABC transporter ATP-binding protein [Bradyrhizobium sp. ISRA443]|uniref:ABC transporter ATP-binding protein n=1 Tax=unclassified Bradyrhizobium TaxID=2631580 RepID=UPI0024789AD3|nr:MULTISPECIES: ABC transporter ATP-binding protein [unclassified Bradyrhizobium]WGR97110.1 ABC transporter ATP-binding protein [Bradyrhizobium sp. ISRA436]WGS03998.1 ABC transporter ATP-binding protein [Bradyrhizobium sp. ISRA437]WGS10881.1 ABC transporter ATP-binding protein [Bradyrhizobium sp. ISRA443]
MARLDINALGKSFGPVRCADGLSFSVEPGEIVAVFGPSGSGKTMLLRMIAGMYEPDEGDILVGGRSIIGAPPERRGVGMAFQNFALFPHMTARDNIASGLRAKAGDADVTSRVKSISRLLKIEHVLGHMPRELSNGQKQRTALARALIGNPDVLLLDDPLRNVDAKLRYEMRLELPSLLRRSSAAVLYVTQDYREAMAIADRIAVLVRGRLVQLARPEEVYAKPASVAVARLFGDPSINLAEVEPQVGQGGLSAEIAGTRVRLDSADQPASHGPCWLGVRPDDLAISRDPGDDAIPARIVAITPMHERNVLLLRLADGSEWLAALPSDASAASADDDVFVRFAPQAALLFDRATGLRVGQADRRQAA